MGGGENRGRLFDRRRRRILSFKWGRVHVGVYRRTSRGRKRFVGGIRYRLSVLGERATDGTDSSARKPAPSARRDAIEAVTEMNVHCHDIRNQMTATNHVGAVQRGHEPGTIDYE